MAGLEIFEEKNGYLIIHTTSNTYLDRFYMKYRAAGAIEELEQLGDWTKPLKSVMRFGKKKIRAILWKWQY